MYQFLWATACYDLCFILMNMGKKCGEISKILQCFGLQGVLKIQIFTAYFSCLLNSNFLTNENLWNLYFPKFQRSLSNKKIIIWFMEEWRYQVKKCFYFLKRKKKNVFFLRKKKIKFLMENLYNLNIIDKLQRFSLIFFFSLSFRNLNLFLIKTFELTSSN